MAVKFLREGEDFSFDKSFGFTGSAQGRHDTRAHPGQDDNEFGDGLAKGGRHRTRRMADGGNMPMPGQPNPGLPGARRQTPRIVPPTGARVPMVAKGGALTAATAPAGPAAPRAPGKPSKVPIEMAANAARGAFKIGARMGAQGVAKRLGIGAQGQGRPAAAPAAAPAAMRPAAPPAPPAAGPILPRAALAPPPPMARPAPTMAPPSGAPPMPAMKGGGKFIQKAVKRPGRMTNLAARHGVSLGEELAKDVHSSDPSLRGAALLGRRFRSGDLRRGKKEH